MGNEKQNWKFKFCFLFRRKTVGTKGTRIVQDVSLKGICMVVMPLFCSTKVDVILLGNQDFGVYFQCNAMDQAYSKFMQGN